jgi:hypothetical protein
MFFKSLTTAFIATVAFFNFLVAEMAYEIQDIGTLQTRASQAIAINNQGQILGWYNIDGTANRQHFFVRDRANSIWMRISGIISVNDNGEIIAQGETIYGEQHAMLLTPVASE